MMYYLQKYLIPHKINNYKPCLLSGQVILMIALIAIGFFLSFLLDTSILRDSSLTASILPRVLLDLANETRRSTKMPSLVYSPVLEKAAREKALDMAAKGYFAHVSPEGVGPWHWFSEVGYLFTYAGENLAMNFNDSVEVNRAWLSSPAHRANIINEQFTEAGIATISTTYQGKETVFIVEMFGTPLILTKTAEYILQKNRDGISIKKSRATEVSLDPLYNDTALVAVKNQEAPLSQSIHKKEGDNPAMYAGVFEYLFTIPGHILYYAYIAITLVLLVTVLFSLMHQKSRKNTLHLMYGFGLIVFIAILFYLAQGIMLPMLII